MSTSLLWRPVRGSKTVPNYGSALKNALREEYGDGDKVLTMASVAFIRGLRAAEVDGAAALIELIEKHGEIVVWEES